MAALRLLLLLLLPLLPPPARSGGPGPSCRLRWVQVGSGAGGCRGGPAAACVGHCESSAFPSPHAVMAAAGRPRTSLARCCTSARARKVHVTLRCPGGARRRLPTVSAGGCRCDMCRQARF